MAQVPVLFDARGGVPGNVSGGGPSPLGEPSAHGDHFPPRRQHKNPPLSSPWLCFCVWGSEEVIAACIWVIKTPDGPRGWLVVAGRQRRCPSPPVFSSSSGTVTQFRCCCWYGVPNGDRLPVSMVGFAGDGASDRPAQWGGGAWGEEESEDRADAGPPLTPGVPAAEPKAPSRGCGDSRAGWQLGKQQRSPIPLWDGHENTCSPLIF